MLKFYLFILLKMLALTAALGQKGFIIEYYNGTEFNTKVTTKYSPDVNFYWDFNSEIENLNSEYFSIKCFGKIVAPETGKYKIGFIVDDGVRLWINDKKIIDAWNLNNKVFYATNYYFEKDKIYDIRIDYFNGMREGKLEFKWKKPSSNSIEIIKNDNLLDITANKREIKPIKLDSIVPIKNITVITKQTKPILNKPISDTIAKYIPKNILFKQSTSEMIGKSEEELALLASFLKRFPLLNVSIEGHTDTNGDARLNQKLSEDRALAVLLQLCKLGIDKNRLTAKGFGGTKSINDANSQNRRVEFIIN
ncbi:MAG: PA14 domain-containing protein [Bacteroidia bacterium]